MSHGSNPVPDVIATSYLPPEPFAGVVLVFTGLTVLQNSSTSRIVELPGIFQNFTCLASGVVNNGSTSGTISVQIVDSVHPGSTLASGNMAAGSTTTRIDIANKPAKYIRVLWEEKSNAAGAGWTNAHFSIWFSK